MVLERDNFCSIIEGVKEGRTIVSNIRKALGCLLTGNLSEILVTGVAVLAGMPIPLIPIQILVMNLLTDAIPAMVLAMNPGNKAKMTRHTSLADRDLYSKVVVRGTLLGLGSLGLFAASLATGASIPAAQTIAFATLVCGQMIQTLSWRREGSSEQVKDLTKDRFMMGAIGVSALALLSVIYVPAFATMFQTVPLSIGHWLKILLVAGSVTTLSKPVHWLIAREKTKTASEPPQILQVA
jgi:magnesium-transporting ATPase (P-type)